ncbi:MAG: methyltransferase domain-containing protein [Planctomycetota bacterium]
MGELYDAIGRGYSGRRRADPRIAARLHQSLEGLASVVNVGAGSGSYEPVDRAVVAVEPSAAMIAQRRRRDRVVQARAERLPLRTGCVDAAMAVLTVHHWGERADAFAECARAARRRVVVLTWDPESDGFWLVRDYFPELLAWDRRVFPALDEFRAAWGRIRVEPVPVPGDCADGFLGAYWRRPAAYLDPTVRAAMSSFARIPGVDDRVEQLRRDLASGAWHRANRALRGQDAADLGYRLVVADLS